MGKPNPGTPADKRLTENKSKGAMPKAGEKPVFKPGQKPVFPSKAKDAKDAKPAKDAKGAAGKPAKGKFTPGVKGVNPFK